VKRAEAIVPEGQDLPLEVRVLFQSPDLLVRQVARDHAGAGLAVPGDAILYVTFDSYTDVRSLERPGFGEEFFKARGIEAIHVLSRDNHWYQHAELPEALAAVAAATRGYDRVFAYGSSMGGFAALHYGADCGANVGIAISPQYSVDPDVAPFEVRWRFDASRITHRGDVTRPLATQYILYDPHDAYDRGHYDLFAARSATIGIKVPYAGHPAGSYLHETDMFGDLFAGIHNGGLDAQAYEHELRARRRRSGQYYFALSRRMPMRRPQQRVALARAAVEAEPNNGLYVSNLAVALDAVAAYDEALRAHREAMALMPGNLHVVHAFVLHEELRGQIDAARDLAEELVKRHPNVFLFRNTRRRLRRSTRHRAWYGKLARWLALDDVLDFGWELATDGLLLPGPAFKNFLRDREPSGGSAIISS
jgi:hypothetical protein